MKRMSLIVLVVIVGLGLGPSRLAMADAAPPWYAQGATVDTSESMTNVQMVSEQVLLVVENRETASEELHLAAQSLTGHVEATFVMRNHGTAEESFDVWFPVGVSEDVRFPASDSKVGVSSSVDNFAAWVDGVPAVLSQEQPIDPSDELGPWVTWPATFPPGRDVSLRVTYDILPVNYHPYGTFHYILETGAGWWGPIGEGAITFRLPYEVSEFNTVLAPHPWTGRLACGHSNAFTASGADVTWHFTDLEPTREDNVCLTMLVPSTWNEIMVAQQEVVANPDSSEAHLRLARALGDTLLFMPSIWPGGSLQQMGSSDAMAESAALSYERALELGGEDVEIYVEYLELVGAMWCSGDDSQSPSAPESLLSALDRALELAPNDRRLLSIQDGIAERESYLARTPTPTPVPSPTSAPIALTATAASAAATSVVATREGQATRQAVGWSADATMTPLPMPAATMTLVPTLPPTTTPAYTQATDGGSLCPGALTVALTPLIALVVRKRGDKTH